MHHQTSSPIGFGFDDLKDVIDNTYQYASRLFEVPLGKIERGYQADLILIDYQPPTPLTKDNVFGHLFFGLFQDFTPDDVFIAGTQVLTNKHLSPRLKQLFLKAPAHAEGLWKKIEKEGT